MHLYSVWMGLAGLRGAIRAAYPHSDIQQCIIHQIRNTLRYASWKERKELGRYLRGVYMVRLRLKKRTVEWIGLSRNGSANFLML
jgi:transposase-like protein